jgi:hypothetical protein
MQQLARKIKDTALLGLLQAIIASYQTTPGHGLPIGNLTSQPLANYYLNGFDHWLGQQPQQRGYLRYVDDFFVFGNDKPALWQLVADIEQYLVTLDLRLHPNKIHLRRTSERVDVLGYLLTADRRWLRNSNGYRFARKLRGFAARSRAGLITKDYYHPRIMSWIGHALHAETQGLRRALFRRTTFR